MSPKGRHAKSKARINQYEKLLSEEGKEKIKDTKISIPAGPRLGNLVIEVNDLSKSYGDRLLFDKLSFLVPPGAIVGIIGPNGAGKTTLFKLIAGAAGQEVPTGGPNGETGIVKPDSGTIRLGDTVKLTTSTRCAASWTRIKPYTNSFPAVTM